MSRVLHLVFAFALCLPLSAWGQSASPLEPPANGGDFSSASSPTVKVPKDTIIVKGAWSSASDSTTPVPEGGGFSNGVFRDPYFGMNYNVPAGWTKSFDGPPPSDSGRYVLAQIRLGDPKQQSSRGSILITADDLFFTPMPAGNALEIVSYMKDHLQADYKPEEPPTPTKIAGRPFAFFAYWSPVAELHWYVAATEIRCHAVSVVFTSRDTKLLANWLLDLDKMTLPAEAGPAAGTGGGEFPVCVKDYARNENVLAKVDPVFPERRGNPVPVRVIIDKEGKVKHIHFLSAFPEQAKAITDALFQWRFKPHLQNGHPVEVETGIMFGRAPRAATASPIASAATE
jgi:hypothetical protein